MDTTVNAALEEICARGAAGILLSDLWPLLSATAGSSIVRKSVLNSLLSLPCLRFSSSSSSSSSSHWSLEEAEGLQLRVVAEEHLRDSFVGIDDLKAAGSEISETQRRVLERIAASRTSGTTQRDLAKEFGIKPNNFFYIVKNLESQQLIVRQSTILRQKELGDEEGNMLKNTQISSTNLLNLRRYGNSGCLNSQQRIEITRSACGDMLESSFDGDVASGEGVKEDILIKDFLPEMRAICDKLEQEGDKIHAVLDIKQALGYSNTSIRHRQWRNIINRMKDAGLVETINAEVENKVVPCLRLLKKFDPNDFQPKTTSSGYDGFDSGSLGKNVKRGQMTDQHFELPIDYQIYDMVDAEGPKGITNFEVCRRLGLNVKKTHSRIMSIISRFGLRLESEIPDKTKAWRVWTQRNYQQYLTNGIHDPVPDKSELPAKSIELVPFEQSSPNLRLLGSLPQDEVHPEKTHGKVAPQQPSKCYKLTTYADVIRHKQARNLVHEFPNVENDAEVRSSMGIIKSNIVLPERPPMASSTTSKQSQRYHGLASTVDATKREQRILTRLKDDKFILFCELFRWLNDLKDKPKLMDRRTLIRTLKKLEEEGLCKHVKITVPVATNCNRTRDENVVLHPSVDISSVLDQISRRLKHFAYESHSRGSSRSDNNPPVAGLVLAERSSNHVDQKQALIALSANGFVRAKMVRVKLFHCFLWGYLSRLHDWKTTLPSSEEDYDQGKHCCTVQFAIKEAIKEMPLQLFLQIIGSTKEIDDLVQKCRAGLRLSDLSVLEYKCLVDDTLGTVRLSRLVGILLRLKLIQIVGAGFVEGADAQPCSVPTHAMELRPYIEEPLPRVLKSSNVVALDLHPRQRHKFYLSTLEDVDRYWLTLECFYAKTDPIASSHAFPGSVVDEVFQLRSWDSARVMTAEQRTELLKRVKNEKQTFTFEECVKIARELNLTVQQVYRDFHLHKDYTASKSKVQENNVEAHHRDLYRKNRKRRRSSKDESLKYVHNDSETRAPSCRATPSTLIFEGNNMDTNFSMPPDTEINDNPMEESKDDSYGNTQVDFNSQGEEDGQSFTFIRQCAFSRIKPTRQKRFSWTDILDRQLIMRYVRIRVVKGARFHHVDWFSLADLPALPGTCRRRMAALRRDKSIRSAIMKLCNLLGDRYSRHLNTLEKGTPSQNNGMSIQRADLDEFLTSDAENSSVSGVQPSCWDDFSDPDIEIAVNEILRCKRMAKLESARRIGASQVKGWTDNPQTEGTILDDQEHVMSKEQSSIPSDLVENDDSHSKRWKKNTNTSVRSRARCHQSHAKFLKLLNNRGIKIRREVCESLAAANAVELVKLVFLSNSAALQASLAATLRLYSESDLFVAFSYLKEKDFMIVGQGNQPFKLSSKFWHGASSSIFPIDSGKRAVEFSSWLRRQHNDLEDGVDLTSDLQCGEIFHLFALVSLEEVLISPCMPKEGTGEPDEPKSPKSLLPMDDLYGFDEQTSLKRKRDENRQCISENIKNQKAEGKMDGELFNRREKGFPGIKVLITRPKFQRADVAPCVTTDNKKQTCLSVPDDASKPTSYSNMEITMAAPSSNDLNLPYNFGNSAQSGMPLNEPPWDMMVKYAANLSSTSDGKNDAMSFHPELFKSVHSVICQAGEQGLTIEEIAKTMGNQEIKLVEVAIDALETFQLAYKVNAYDCMKVVDSSYRSKYFISMLADHNQDSAMVCPMISQAMSYEGSQEISRRKHDKTENQDARSANLCCGHEVTPINLPPRSCVPCVETHGENAASGEGKFSEAVSVENDYGNKTGPATGVQLVYRPILPWLNSDGSSNTIMYKGLTRRVLGTVMQKPGILEEDLIGEMDVLNPQTCRRLLETMVCNNHIIVRTMLQTTSGAPPSILQGLFNSKIIEPKLELRKHYFANPMSTSLL